MSDQERKLDAAEYVIGTLSAVERTAFEASIETDATTRDDVQFWERTFGSLNASVSPEAPPDGLWKRIDTALPAQAGEASAGSPDDGSSDKPSTVAIAANDNVTNRLRRSVRRWRLGAVAATIAAIGLGAYIVNSPINPFAPPSSQSPSEQMAQGDGLSGKQYIAVVNASGDQPSLVINIDAKTGNVTVRSVGVERPDGKSLELWYVPNGQTAVSVGLVGEGAIDLKDIQAKDGDLLAISVEPPGGSPEAQATGPVIYTGKLVENVNPK
ncbi:MAG: hypothetical protein GKR97_13595 [Rhizobiaceae bacterium]|nr:hypothetical protein [Rhizobiaceae bacterium]